MKPLVGIIPQTYVCIFLNDVNEVTHCSNVCKSKALEGVQPVISKGLMNG